MHMNRTNIFEHTPLNMFGNTEKCIDVLADFEMCVLCVRIDPRGGSCLKIRYKVMHMHMNRTNIFEQTPLDMFGST